MTRTPSPLYLFAPGMVAQRAVVFVFVFVCTNN